MACDVMVLSAIDQGIDRPSYLLGERAQPESTLAMQALTSIIVSVHLRTRASHHLEVPVQAPVTTTEARQNSITQSPPGNR